MVEFIPILSPPFSKDLIETLSTKECCYHPDPDSEGYRILCAAQVKVQPLIPGSLESGTVLIPEATGSLEHLNQIVVRLLGEGGCPWDQAQTHESLKKYLIEESYELFDAIDDNDAAHMVEELGDVLLQPLMHAEMASLAGEFNLDAVCDAIGQKLVRRHPHVFGDSQVTDADEVLKNWDKIKKSEKGNAANSILTGIPRGMPSLMRALEVSKRAARQGFEWESVAQVWDKFDEEKVEFLEAVEKGSGSERFDEMGDLLFTLVNIARHSKIEPEQALHQMINRFIARFSFMETQAQVPLGELSAQEWDALWTQAKSF